jgi:hypothetical protein
MGLWNYVGKGNAGGKIKMLMREQYKKHIYKT